MVVATCVLLAACGGGDSATDDPTADGAATTAAAETAAAPADTGAPPDDTGAADASAEPITIAYFAGFGPNNSFVDAQFAGIEAAAAAAGNVEVERFDAAGDATTQFAQIQDATATGKYAGFVIIAVDGNAVVPAIEEALADGIEVACIFAPCGPDQNTQDIQVDGMIAQIGSSAEGEGSALGEEAVKACEGKDPCEVALIFGFKASGYDTLRSDAFKAVLAEHPNIDLVQEAEGMSDSTTSQALMQDIIQAHPGIDAVATSGGDQSGAGAEIAIDGAGLTGQVAIIGNGASEIGVEAVREGRWQSTVSLLPYTEGETAADAVIRAARGEEFEPIGVVETELSPIGAVVTADNVDQFEAQWPG